jgi:hypothetical protein
VFGRVEAGVGRHYASPNYKLASRFTLERELTVVRVSAFLSGRGSSGSQSVRAVVYSDSGGSPASLMATSQEASIPYNAAANWNDFALPQPVTLQPGDYWLGLHSGPSTGDALINYAFTSSPAAQRTKSDLYSDGPADVFGNGNAQDRSMAIYAAPSLADGLSEVANSMTGSSDPTYYANNRRLAKTRAGRLLAVYGKHATGVQLAWRDPARSWQSRSRGEVSDGILLSGTGTGDWPASIVVAQDPSGTESAWVVWSRASFGTDRPVQFRRLSALDAPDGPIVGPIVTVDAPPLGAARADLAFEQLADGSLRGCIVWTRRVADSLSEVAAAWFTDLGSDVPVLHDFAVVVPAGGGARTATLIPTAAGLRVATPALSGHMQLFGHDTEAPLTEWWAGARGVVVGSSSRPAAVATDAGDVIVAVEADVLSNTTSVQRFTRSTVSDELNLTGYSMPSLATDGTSTWLVAVRRSDGYVISRTFAPGAGWSDSDRVEIGEEGGGGYAWPNLLRQVDGRLRLIVQGPSGATSRAAVLAYQRPTS